MHRVRKIFECEWDKKELIIKMKEEFHIYIYYKIPRGPETAALLRPA
jgi:hypothetical protein